MRESCKNDRERKRGSIMLQEDRLSQIKEFIKAGRICDLATLLPSIYGDFDEMQEGYRWNPVEECSLITGSPGAWEENWYVIAQNALGDPFFVDVSTAECPVFTAMHGAGCWEPIKLADSLAEFIEIFKKISELDWTKPESLMILDTLVDTENEFWMEFRESMEE